MLLPRARYYPLHAAGLSVPGERQAVILAGPSGCGKSTLTAGLLNRGWRCLSDDLLVLIPPTDATPQVRAYGLTQHVRLWPDAWERLGLSDRDGQKDLGPYGAAEKRRFAPHLERDDHSERVSEPHWLLFPEITDCSQSRLTSMEASEALKQGFEQMPPPAALPDAVAADQFDAVAALVRQSRCLRLQAGRDLYDEPGRLAELLRAYASTSFSDTRTPASMT